MIYVWVRATANWANRAAFEAQLDPAFRPKVELWDATFDMPYHRFRHELREIAALNLSRVEGATVAPWGEIPEGALVLPVDDDDWFSPQVASVLEHGREPAVTGYHWTSSFLEVPIDLGHHLGLARRRLFPRTPPRWLCTTNNYALIKSPETEALLRLHTRASEWFRGDGRSRVKRIEGRLSLMNRTLASRTSLGHRRPTISRRELLRKYARYRSLYARPLDPELAWSEPYRAQMGWVMERLGVRVG